MNDQKNPITVDQLAWTVGLHSAARLVVLKSLVVAAGGPLDWESGRPREGSHPATVVKVEQFGGSHDTYTLSCGHEHTEAHDDEAYSLVGATTGCQHVF